MYLRKLLLLIGVVSLLLTGRAFALGLGDITLNSALNQPLDAHASLLDVGPLDADQIIVNLASQEDFDRAGLERPFFYNQLRFNVVTESPQGPYIAITTREPVREPYLSFIVEVRWSSGRLLREYTLLLDLPVFADDEAQPVAAAGGAERSRPAKTEPVQRAESPRPAVSATPSASGRSSSTYGPVESNDTLWEIALQVRPSGVSVQQTMLAIQRANPDAFINNNINLLRRGQVLRIPADNDIRSITARQAISEVASQNRQWSGNAMGAQLDASGRSAQVSRSSGEVSGRVRLAGGDNGGASDTATGSGGGGADGRALEEELSTTKDELRRAQGESTELRSRVRELEDQIDTMERLLEATNEQMRALELAAASAEGEGDSEGAARSPEDEASDPAVTDDAESQSDPLSGDTATDPVTDSATPADGPEPVAEPEPAADSAVAESTRVVRRAPPPKTLMDHVMDNLVWIVAALVVLMLLIVLVMRKRQAASQEDYDESEEGDDFPDPGFEMDQTQEMEEVTEDESLELDLGEEEPFEEGPARAETDDVVGEADIYIQLGKYDQAEEMLRRGLEDEPDSQEIQLKLLELYAESNNLEAFDERYGQLLKTADAAGAARARELRSQFANAPAFDESAIVPAAAAATATSAVADAATTGEDDDDGGFDLDLDLDTDSTETLGGDDELLLGEEDKGSDSFDLDDDFSFDLDDDLESEEAPATSEKDVEGAQSGRYDLSFDEDESDTESTSADDELLDFSLDLDDDEGETTTASATEKVEDDDEFSLDFDSDDELTPVAGDATETDTGDDDFSFSLEDDESVESADIVDSEETQAVDTLADEEDFSLSLDDKDTTEATDDLSLEDEEEVPTLDLADDDADDFDLDSAMGDLDIDALDKEMADLDADIGEESQAQTPAAPASEEDDTFDEALSDLESDDDLQLNDLPTPEESNSASADEAQDDDLDFLADADEAATKLDLARAYIDMGDMDGARDILAEVAEEGNDEQRSEAQSLLERVES